MKNIHFHIVYYVETELEKPWYYEQETNFKTGINSLNDFFLYAVRVMPLLGIKSYKPEIFEPHVQKIKESRVEDFEDEQFSR